MDLFQKEIYNNPSFNWLKNSIIAIFSFFGLFFVWNWLSLGFTSFVFVIFSSLFAVPLFIFLFIFIIPLFWNQQKNFDQITQFFIDSQSTFTFQISNQISFGIDNQTKYLDFSQLKMQQTKSFLIFRQVSNFGISQLSFDVGHSFGESFFVLPKAILTEDELGFISSKFAVF